MDYFIFKDKNSRDIKELIVNSLPPISKPSKRVSKTEIEGRDGDIIEFLGYESYDKTIKITILEETNIDELINWLNGSGKLILSNEPDKYYEAEIIEQIDFDRLFKYEPIEIVFHCQPYKYLVDEEKKIIEMKSTEVSEEIVINDSCQANMKLEIGGNSVQETRSGKNKMNVEDITTLSVDNIDFNTSSFTIENKWAASVMYADKVVSMLKPTTKYKMIADVTLLSKPETLGAGNHERLLTLYNGTTNIPILKVTNLTEKNNWQINQKKHLKCEFTTPDSLENYRMLGYCYIVDSSTSGGSFKYENVMILEDTETNERFEQYGAMPSTKYPSQKRNCGDNINIFDKDNLIKVADSGVNTNQIENGIRLIATNTGTHQFHVYKILDVTNYKGKSFTLKANWIVSSSNTGRISLGLCNEDGSVRNIIENGDTSGQSITYTIPSDLGNTKYLAVWLYVNTTGTLKSGDYVDYTEIKLEPGTKATKWSKHGCGNVNLKVQNKNICTKTVLPNANNIRFYFDTQTISKTFSLSLTTNVQLNKNSLYLVIDGENASEKLVTTLTAIDNKVKQTITLTDKTYNEIRNGKIAYFLLYKSNAGFTLPDDVQIENDLEVTDYVEHEEQTVTFPLSQGQILHDGDYLADDGIHHKRKTIELDGTETWNILENRPNIYYLTVQNIAHNAKVLCSHYLYTSHTLSEMNVNEISTVPGTGYYIWFKSEQATLNEFKAYLAEQYANGTPVTLEYELLNEEIEAYTEEQKVVKKQIDELYSYQEVTHITCEDEIKTKMKLSYFSKDDIVLENKGYVESKPIIIIHGTGNISVSLNNSSVFSIDMQNDASITIDAIQEDAYQGSILKNRQMNGEFDKIRLQPGENTISWTGNLSKIEIEPKSRWL